MKICILTAGKGSRIGDLCKNINKALLPIDHKAIISQIIEKFDKDDTFVIGLGYKKEQVEKYLKITHPDKKFIFVNIKNHDGPGSGPGLSLLSCKRYLNEPFVFVPCDCNFISRFPTARNQNWIGISKVPIEETSQYCNVLVKDFKVKKIKDKEKSPKEYFAFTGLTYIKDYKIFWNGLKQGILIQNEHQISNGLRKLIQYSDLHTKKIKWQDMGTLEQFKEMQKRAKLKNIAKENEFIYFEGNRVIKFFDKEDIINKKILKAKSKPSFFPKIKKFEKNFFSYDYWKGDVFYESGTPIDFKKLLKYLNKSFWTSYYNKEKNMKKLCELFYHKKTIERIGLFLECNPEYVIPKSVNGEFVLSIKEILNEVPWKELTKGVPCFIHGDLNFSNILYNRKDDKFLLIDWRQDFSGEIEFGDLYYDLAKLYAGIIMNFNHVIKKQYDYFEKNESVRISFKQWRFREKYIKVLEDFIISKKLDVKKVRLLAGITFLNMAPLHPNPINKILIAYGQLIITKVLKEK